VLVLPYDDREPEPQSARMPGSMGHSENTPLCLACHYKKR